MIAKTLFRALGRCAPSPIPLPEGVELRTARWLPELGGRIAGTGRAASAVTVGDTILVHPDAVLSEALIRHELAHVRQWRASPWTFVVRYALGHLRYGYRNNPYEIDARKAETADADG